jgi:2-polyprenyl-3-methyl-5-hydroxy-6-metoxy-1,4-benzoquinol methylase
MSGLSPRLMLAIGVLPLRSGMSVIEIGCGPGAMAREIAVRVGPHGRVLGLDRSAKAIAQARGIPGQGWLEWHQASIEKFAPAQLHGAFDLAVALRVGVLDGRHPTGESAALRNIALLLRPGGRLFVDNAERDPRIHSA